MSNAKDIVSKITIEEILEDIVYEQVSEEDATLLINGTEEHITTCCQALTFVCHQLAATWYLDPTTGEMITVNSGERFMLIVSEIAEAMEGNRKNLMDDKLPHRKMEEVELADAIIRIFDYAGYKKLDIGSALIEKLAYNARRVDHKPENRAKEQGKKY